MQVFGGTSANRDSLFVFPAGAVGTNLNCVGERERKRERAIEKERESDRERERDI
jgi:hypothetical protein